MLFLVRILPANGKIFEEEIEAASHAEAYKLIQARHNGCHILRLRERIAERLYA